MRLIDADQLKYEAETCIETTDAFIELIDKMPTVNLSNLNIEDNKISGWTIPQ